MYKSIKLGNLTAKLPIVQGGMGVGVSLERLASAVANCGGIGVLSAAQIGFREPEYENDPTDTNIKAVKKYIQKAKKMTTGNGIVGINIMVATRRYEEYVQSAVEAGADLIVSGAGLPARLPKYTNGTPTKIAPIFSSERAADILLHMWEKKYQTTADMVVIEGPDAGGHLGFSPDELKSITKEKFADEVKKIIECVKKYGEKFNKKIPVILGGGITTADDVDEAMKLGVDGVQVATRFVTTKECDASDEFKQCYINSRKEDIEIIQSPVGMPGRAIHNKFLERVHETPDKITKCYQCIKSCNSVDTPYCISRALINAVKGDVDNGLIFCGANAYKSDKIETVQEVINDLLRL